jgi:hypothetical protein
MKNYKKINAEDLHYLEASDMHPANTSFHFSFANYYDPNNINFGTLRVINDDAVKPNSGFGTHPHDNMEIFSYVVDGKLTHRDSAGNHEILSRGHVQCISAGTGLTHSEMNEQDDWCRFLQIWIKPEEYNLPIRYDFHKFTLEDRNNKLLQIISSSKNSEIAPLYLCQDVNVYVSELTDKNKCINFTLNDNRQAYIFCFEGNVDIKGYPSLKECDSLKVFEQDNFEFSLASDNAHFIIIEMNNED